MNINSVRFCGSFGKVLGCPQGCPVTLLGVLWGAGFPGIVERDSGAVGTVLVVCAGGAVVVSNRVINLTWSPLTGRDAHAHGHDRV